MNAIVAPRAATRELVGEPNEKSKTLFWSGVIAVVVSYAAVSLIVLKTLPHLHSDSASFFGAGVDGIILDSLFLCALEIAAFPIALFMWNRIFRYKSASRAVLAATALGFAINLVAAMPLNVIDVWSGNVAGGVESIALALQVVVGLGLTSAYYSEALAIGYVRAVALNALSFAAVVLAGFIILILMLLVLYAAGYELPILNTELAK